MQEDFDLKLRTGDSFLDVIVNYYLYLAEKEHIEFTVSDFVTPRNWNADFKYPLPILRSGIHIIFPVILSNCRGNIFHAKQQEKQRSLRSESNLLRAEGKILLLSATVCVKKLI